jgi:hypothetical protein
MKWLRHINNQSHISTSGKHAHNHICPAFFQLECVLSESQLITLSAIITNLPCFAGNLQANSHHRITKEIASTEILASKHCIDGRIGNEMV